MSTTASTFGVDLSTELARLFSNTCAAADVAPVPAAPALAATVTVDSAATVILAGQRAERADVATTDGAQDHAHQRSTRRPYRAGGGAGWRYARQAHWPKVQAVTITEQPVGDGIEIRFPKKPPDGVREALKANGWRFNGASGCWFNRRTDANRQYAELVRRMVEGA